MNGEEAAESFEIKACFLERVPALDGTIGQDFWAAADLVHLSRSRDRGENAPVEGGTVGVGWNEAGLYLAARLVDSELVATALRDEEFHYAYGDVLELFVKPLERPCYWEMYVTPAGNKSTLFFSRPLGETQPHRLTGHNHRGLKVAAQARPATPNLAAGWDAEMWVPAAQLTTSGEPWSPSGEWSFFVGRYNHDSSLQAPELSMWPPLPWENYHLTGNHARLRLQPAR